MRIVSEATWRENSSAIRRLSRANREQADEIAALKAELDRAQALWTAHDCVAEADEYAARQLRDKQHQLLAMQALVEQLQHQLNTASVRIEQLTNERAWRDASAS